MNRKKPVWRWLLWLGGAAVGVPALLFLVALGMVLYERHYPPAAKEIAPLPPPVIAPDSVLGPLHTPTIGATAAARSLFHPAPNALAVTPGTALNVAFGRPPAPAEMVAIWVFSGQCQLRQTMQAATIGNVAQLTLASGRFGAGDIVTVSGPGAGNKAWQFTVHAGGGGHTYSGQQAVPVRAQPSFLHVGDIDGDGDLDLLTANISDNTISVRLNDGRGVFSGNEGIVLGADELSQMAVGDIDGDGDPDLLTAGGKSTIARIWRNDGTGHFTQAWGVDMGSSDTSPAFGDVDGDGDLDALFADWAGRGAVNVRFNDGHGVFGGGSRVAVGSYPSAPALGDIDGDGDLDLLTANYGGIRQSVSVRLNNGQGTFGGTLDVTAGTYSKEVLLGDVDGDGDLDLLARDDSHTAYLRLNDRHGTFWQRRAVYLGCLVEDIALNDVDGDGDLDLVGSALPSDSALPGRVSIWRNDGRGFFGAANKNRQDIRITAPSDNFVMADVDGDGDLDLLAAAHDDTVNIRLSE
jgi:hypothetical protein